LTPVNLRDEEEAPATDSLAARAQHLTMDDNAIKVINIAG